jgi:hypothetical protein
LGAGIITLVLILLAIILIANRRNDRNDQPITDILLCDLSSDELCIVTFGANNLNRMVINFQLPSKDYPDFYVKGKNRGAFNVYSCETSNISPTSTYCTGMRTPLGEPIQIEVYTTDGDLLIARGTFMVSAILLSGPTEAIFSDPVETGSTPGRDIAYPNP